MRVSEWSLVKSFIRIFSGFLVFWLEASKKEFLIRECQDKVLLNHLWIFFRISLLLQRNPGKESSLKGPGLRARSLKNSPGVFSAFWLLRPKGFIPSQIQKRPAYRTAGLMFLQPSCQVSARAHACRCDILWRTDPWISDRGDLVGGVWASGEPISTGSPLSNWITNPIRYTMFGK